MADFKLRIEGVEDLDALTAKIERLVTLLREADALVAGLASHPDINLKVAYDGPTFGGGVQQAAREIAAVLNREGDRLALHPLLTKSS